MGLLHHVIVCLFLVSALLADGLVCFILALGRTSGVKTAAWGCMVCDTEHIGWCVRVIILLLVIFLQSCMCSVEYRRNYPVRCIYELVLFIVIIDVSLLERCHHPPTIFDHYLILTWFLDPMETRCTSGWLSEVTQLWSFAKKIPWYFLLFLTWSYWRRVSQ